MTAFGTIIDADSQTKNLFVCALEKHFDEYHGGMPACVILPDARVPIKVQDTTKDVSGSKSLLGFALWHNRYAGDFK